MSNNHVSQEKQAKQPEVIELRYPCKAEYVGISRLLAAGIASRMNFTYDEIEDIKIAIGESCVNVVHHAYPDEHDEGNDIVVRCLVYPHKLVVIVKDTGRGFDLGFVQKYVKRRDFKKPPKIGLGIFLIKTVMDEVEYDTNLPHGTQVRMVKYLSNSTTGDFR